MESSHTSHDWKKDNICQCCLSGNCYLTMEYFISGQKEIYKTMLKDTFNIEICDKCITRLRESSLFKLEVLQSQTAIQNHKSEILSSSKVWANYFETTSDLSTVKQESTETVVATAKEGQHDIGFNQKEGCNSFDDDDEPQCNKKDWLKISERRGNGPLLRENSLKLIANSTICVFQWNKSRYRCFCCKEPFSDINQLREHTSKEHTIKNIERNIIIQQNRLVKAEISSLYCKLCSIQLEDLNSLRRHLETAHGIKFDLLKEDLIVPFKIESDTLTCQLCSENFNLFRLLNIHMNKHYQKQVCHICGAGFSNLVFLNLHKTRSHRPLKCDSCKLEFSNKSEKKNHDLTFHNVGRTRKCRFPCPFCSERFIQENFRVQHLVDNHGMRKPEFKCTSCPKIFITKSLCNNHVKNVHLKERRRECDICQMRFYTKSDVARHRVTHTGEKNFSCSLCHNLFASKDSLRRHNKRTHVNVN